MLDDGNAGDGKAAVKADDHFHVALGARFHHLDDIAGVARLEDVEDVGVAAGVFQLFIAGGGQDLLHGLVLLFLFQRGDAAFGHHVDHTQQQSHDGAERKQDQCEFHDLIHYLDASFSALGALTGLT